MDNTKRKLTSIESSEENSKKSRNQLVNSLENLSNDLFYEIYDYLEGLDICVAFSNLNSRFQQLITCSTNQYKIILDYSTTKELFWNYSKKIKHQIYSISFQSPKSSINEFFSIDYSFNNVQSIFIEDIEKDQLISLLTHLRDLSCLYLLNIKSSDLFEDLSQIYQLIFSLPKLKSNKLGLYADQYSISIPISNNQQLSPITYLHIAHSYTFDELSALLSYTPSLRHLNLSHSSRYDSYIEDLLPMNSNELIHLSIFSNNLNFDEFQLFVEQIRSKLQILYVNFLKRDIRFLHADRWQKLLLENFSQLKKFSLCYREPGYGDNYPIYDGELNQFVSPFWIQRNLIFDIEVYECNIYYFVRPFKERWYEYPIEHSKLTQLTIKYVYSNELPDILLNQIKRVLNFTQIYHLNIEQKISFERLMQIIHLLPDLISLKVNPLSFYEAISRFGNQKLPTTFAFEHASNIKYVCLEKTCTMEDISFLMSFCPHMEYLNVEWIKNMNIQSFLREILNKINQNHHEYLHALCIHIATADDQMIKQLKQMIDDEKLLLDYTIYRQLYNIYLKWK
ncbi:unnamed protein product [Adineta steineri]|uniref:F-box domain-containing protein n=1 Tax=Adineta steineri TaxID=433720 RepID=A0A819GUY8_9BILA|nr:unnamed protein product [Adineta steineri]